MAAFISIGAMILLDEINKKAKRRVHEAERHQREAEQRKRKAEEEARKRCRCQLHRYEVSCFALSDLVRQLRLWSMETN